MKKLFLLMALILSLSMPGFVSASVVVLNPYSLPYGAPSGAINGVIATTDQYVMGSGSWKNNKSCYPSGLPYPCTAGNTSKMWLNVAPLALFGKSITIKDIAQISYYTNKPNKTAVNVVDYSLGINIKIGTLNYWLNAEPMWAKNKTDVPNTWIKWDTNSVNNQMTFYQLFKCPSDIAGWGEKQPTLADLQAGSINWSIYRSTSPTNCPSIPVDYRNASVNYFSFSTGSGWNYRFNGYIDAVQIKLKSGEEVIFDLEPPQVCGNNVIEGTEVCDGTALAGKTCVSQGFTGGTLACSPTCNGFDTSSCYICTDADNDGYSIEGGLCGLIDCKDGNAVINPEATEILCNGIDENCNALSADDDYTPIIEGLSSGNAGLKAIDTKCCVKKVNGNWIYDDPTSDKDSHGDYVRCVVTEAKTQGFTGKSNPKQGTIAQTAAKSNVNMPETSNSPIGPTGFAVLDTKGVGFFCYNFGWFC